MDEEGETVVEYCYDAWGNVVDKQTTRAYSGNYFAENNPMLYRSYYYDNEINAYYLQSRYYAPSLCRFLNADEPEYAQIQKGLSSGTNLFAYCCNNPVNYYDTCGTEAVLFGIAVPTSVFIFTAFVTFLFVAIVGFVFTYQLNNYQYPSLEISLNIDFVAEHKKNSRPSTHDKHTKPRPGRISEKKKQKDGWNNRSNKRQTK